MVPILHDLVLRDTSNSFCAFHGIAAIRIRVFDIREAEGTSTILITGEFGCTHISPLCTSERRHSKYRWLSQHSQQYQTVPHQSHETGHSVHTESQRVRPFQWW